jgi:hypothetical protein
MVSKVGALEVAIGTGVCVGSSGFNSLEANFS